MKKLVLTLALLGLTACEDPKGETENILMTQKNHVDKKMGEMNQAIADQTKALEATKSQ